jgi:DNA-binding transcriptional ArsR family regulator
MELDYGVIKALSSPTRIKILHRVREKPATPTQLSDEIGKSKSTIASHLAMLVEAGLVEKDEEEGRRRVTYAPTRKARAIVEGRERTVKFSVASSVLSAVVGIGLIGSRFMPSQAETNAGGGSGDQAGSLTMESADAAVAGSDTTNGFIEAVMAADTAVWAGGILFLIAGVTGLYLIRLVRNGHIRRVNDD